MSQPHIKSYVPSVGLCAAQPHPALSLITAPERGYRGEGHERKVNT